MATTKTLIGNVRGPKGDTGNTGASAGFGTPTASIDSNIGTPQVIITASGEDTSKVFDFQFKNLKGETGEQGIQGPKGDTGEQGPQGIQGPKGDTGEPGTTTWAGITDKPTAFPPEAHNHNDLYYGKDDVYTKTEADTITDIIDDKVDDIAEAYLKNATVANNKLTITKQDDSTVEFEGGSNEPAGNLPTEIVTYIRQDFDGEYKVFCCIEADTNRNNFTIDWGDGNQTIVATPTAEIDEVHSYEAAGVYKIKLYQGSTGNINLSLNGSYPSDTTNYKSGLLLQRVSQAHRYDQLGFKYFNGGTNIGEICGVTMDGYHNPDFTRCGNRLIFNGNNVFGSLSYDTWELPYNLYEIRSAVFEYSEAGNYKTLIVGENISRIANEAFYRNGIEKIIFKKRTPCTLNSSFVFYTNTKIIVPWSPDHSILAAYKAANNWAAVADRIYEAAPEYIIPETV